MSNPEVTFDAEKHEYRDSRGIVPSVTQILESVGITDFASLGRFGVDLEEAKERGTIVHQLTEMHDRGTLDDDSVDPELVGYLDGWKAFLSSVSWKALRDGIEKVVYREDWRYAGTVDRIGVLNGRPAILDIKTGTKHPATGVQLAGYEFANTQLIALERYGVYLTNEGAFSLVKYDSPSDLMVFLKALSIHQWKVQHNVK